MSELEKLLTELKNMKDEPTKIFNAKEIWDGIAQKKSFSEMGFESKEEFDQYISENPYGNL